MQDLDDIISLLFLKWEAILAYLGTDSIPGPLVWMTKDPENEKKIENTSGLKQTGLPTPVMISDNRKSRLLNCGRQIMDELRNKSVYEGKKKKYTSFLIP